MDEDDGSTPPALQQQQPPKMDPLKLLKEAMRAASEQRKSQTKKRINPAATRTKKQQNQPLDLGVSSNQSLEQMLLPFLIQGEECVLSTNPISLLTLYSSLLTHTQGN
jgi:hypothetical protein